jgi:short-subunit dehydrogenase
MSMADLALVTGASSGIGRDLAIIHAERGGDLVLVARRRDRLEELAAAMRDRHGVTATVLARDLARPGAAAEIHREVSDLGLEVGILINNAGFGGHGLFHEADPARHTAMLQVNVTALTELTRAFLPAMIARGRGRVLNLASTAAFMPGPLQAVYFATKAYVLSFSEALAVELEGTGVTVTTLCPGATATEFEQTADLDGSGLFERGAASSRDVAETGYRAMMAGKTVVVHGALNKAVPGLMRVMPRKAAAKVARRMMEKT